MPKNIKGGKGHKKLKNNVHKQEKILLYKEDSVHQEYAVVTEAFGSGMKVKFIDNKGSNDGTGVGQLKICHALSRGKMRKWRYYKGDVLLISRRDYEDDKVDIIHKYDEKEINKLKYEKEINSTLAKDIKINNGKITNNTSNDDGLNDIDNVEFEEDDNLSYGFTEAERNRNIRKQTNDSYADIYDSLAHKFGNNDIDDIDDI